MIAYASIYGNTENAAEILASKLRERGVRTAMYDVSVTPASDIIAECFRWSHLVFASATYNGGIFVTMDELLRDIAAHNLQHQVDRRRAAGAGVALAVDLEDVAGAFDVRKPLHEAGAVFPMDGAAVAFELAGLGEHVGSDRQGT